ncbi:rhodanese-like domain-containing protein [Sulfurovum sp.]|uniref:rhodanese-like domain-containing protein n=1 Tax=Sulfurovum sp. TaxID=1969726 RepID=UPI002868250E|nr:rhodanese-like domain-containing protein [Sulfurovum sp.]
MKTLLEKEYINSEELEILLEERDAGKIDFILVDVREEMEYNMGHIKGVDLLKPTSEFSNWAHKLLNETKEKTLIFTCRTGSRSGQVQNVFKQNGHTHSLNHFGGIVTYRGEIES